MTASSASSIYDEDSSPSTPTQPQKTNWPDLPESSHYIKRNGWEHRCVPSELAQYPDEVNISPLLQKILDWSLIPGSNWSYQSSESGSTSDSCNTHHSTPQSSSRDSQISVVSKADVKTPTSSVENVSTSSYKTSLTRLSFLEKRTSRGDKSISAKLLSVVGSIKSHEGSKPVAVKAECISCFDEFAETEMVLLPSCRHWYCHECLSTLVVTAMVTEASFPPKCCLSPIPLKQILRTLSATQREEYQEKAAEYSVPATDRWYCPNKDCLKWIPPSKLKINKQSGYDCPHCTAKLCRTCRGEAHPTNTECPQDFGLEATLETAELEGWQRCYSCRTLVERNNGCRHISCRCGAHFCYVCGLRWQTCSCTETDAINRRDAAQARIRERNAQRDAEAAEIAQAIAEVEAMERREAEERRLEEEEQLRALEALRLLEEAKRLEDEATAEREFRAALVKSFRDEWAHVEETCHKMQAFQVQKVNCRHRAEDLRLTGLDANTKAEAKDNFDTLSQILVKNCGWRHRRLAGKHVKEQEELTVRQEEEEDDTFLQAQMRLRGKANKESRLERMMGEIQKQHEDERAEMEKAHAEESQALEKKIEIDSEGLQRWYETKIHEANDKQKVVLQKFGYNVGADRQYCEVVFERRRQMLTKHESISLANLEAGEDLVGLSELEASKVEPFLPEPQESEPGPSGISRQHGSGSDESHAQTSPLVSCDEPVAKRESTDIVRPDVVPMPVSPKQADSSTHTSSPPIPGAFPVNTSPILPITQPARPPVPAQTQIPAPQSSLTVEPLRLHRPIDPNKPNMHPPVPVRFAAQRQQVNMLNSPVSPLSPTAVLAPPPPPAKSFERLTLQRAAAARAERKGNNGGRWGFMSRHHNNNNNVVSDEEVKYKLQSAVGDASLGMLFRNRISSQS